MSESKLVKLTTLSTEHEMLLPLIKDAFEKEGIRYHFKSMHDSAYDGLFTGQKGAGAIYVFKEQEEQARAILTDLVEASGT